MTPDEIVQLRRAIRGIGPRVDAKVMTGSLNGFSDAIDKHTSVFQREPAPRPKPILAMKLFGMDVIEHPYMPPNIAVLTINNKIVQIMKFGAQDGAQCEEIAPYKTDNDLQAPDKTYPNGL